MTLDEAIKNHIVQSERALHDIEYYTTQNDMEWLDDFKKEYEQFAEEERQLAEWLRELKKYRAIFEKVGKILADNGYTMDDLDTIFGKVNDEEVNADGRTC